jgi:deoxyribonuclease-4
MRFGFHVSIAGGLPRAIEEARARKCETIQIFSRNPQGWRLKPLDPDAVVEFREGIKHNGICPVAVHMPYLENLATGDAALFAQSVESLSAELDRAEQLGAQFVVMHMGRCKEQSEKVALKQMISGIDRAFVRTGSRMPKLLLENTAGMGSSLGYRFEHLQRVIEGVKLPNRLGVVLDTAHLFEAGYDLRTRAGLDQTLREFDASVGLKRLHLLHLNDSKTDLGSRVDRHWHIGQGRIGREGFLNMVNHPLLRSLAGIMETPKTGIGEDRRNMRVIQGLAISRHASTSARGRAADSEDYESDPPILGHIAK